MSTSTATPKSSSAKSPTIGYSSKKKFPFAPVDTIGMQVGDVDLDAVMTNSQANRYFMQMYSKWGGEKQAQGGDGTLTDEERHQLFNKTLVYLAANAPSSRGNYPGEFQTNSGYSFSKRMIYEVLRDEVRKFFRTWADEVRALLKHPDNHEIALELASRRGLPSDMAALAYDGAEFCRDPALTKAERLALKEVKNAVLSTTPSYNAVNSGVAAKSRPAPNQQPRAEGPPSDHYDY
jgi:hypothetical protein